MADLTVEPDTGSSHNPLLQVLHEVHAGVTVVRAVGDVDLATAPLLSQHLSRAEEHLTSSAPLVLDLTGVGFLASAGLSELIRHSERCTELGSRLVVVATHRAVLRSIQITGLANAIALAPSVDDALNIEAGH